MPLENHSLVNEFPDMKDKIHQLKMNDSHFARLFKEYDEVEHEVHRYESGAAATSDDHLEDLKKQRLKLKDELFGMLKAA